MSARWRLFWIAATGALTLAQASQAASVTITALQTSSSTWNLLIESDVAIGDGSFGIVGATGFSAFADQASSFSCAFQTCGTQGPGLMVGGDVDPLALYFQWAAGST